jgi:NAD(P)-dependent dehydrogenase (short-subunit alcohol dehydrogenase family)
LEFCRQLLARGDHVVAGCRKPGRAKELNALAFEHPGRLNVLPLDLTKPDSSAGFAREFALVGTQLDLLINNAGISPEGERFGTLEQRHLLDAFATNAAGAVLLTQALAPPLCAASAPRVMNLSSDLGSIAHCDSFYTPSYCISKAALNMATRLLGHELGPRGVVCFAVNPGWVRTDMGGARAPLAVAESVAALIALAGRADAALNGGFFERDGSAIPW